MKRKKAVRQRGHRTHGYGSPKKHRGKGSRGGKGKAGHFGHMMTRILKYETERIGKTGFRPKTSVKARAVNLREAVRLAGKEKKIDLGALGYDKLLGTGEIRRPLEIKVDYFSKGAKEKVEKAGGKIISDAVVGEAVEEVIEETVEESSAEESK
jgi:large subunit ribosomal protein L15